MRSPVEGNVRYRDDFAESRGGGSRRHEGNDLFGRKLQRVVAVADGVVTDIETDTTKNAGNLVEITDAQGWLYAYFHLNNDTPGTDDGKNPAEWIFVPGLALGSQVVAGQHIGYLGDSGNAERLQPHVHFEIRRPGDKAAVNPFPSLARAEGQPTSRPVARAVASHPDGGSYVLTGDGRVHAYGGAPDLGWPSFSSDVARALAVTPDGQGYVVLDRFGGLHKFGSASTGPLGSLDGPYWPGHDIARGLAITPSGNGYAVLDGYGGVHTYGDAPPAATPYWDGRDLGRSIAFSPSGRGTYVLDAYGGVHTGGDAVKQPSAAYWLGWDIARALVVSSSGDGYAVLDGFGAVHTSGDAPALGGGAAALGSDWRGLALTPDGSGYLAVRRDGLSERRSS